MKCNRRDLFDALAALGKVADKKAAVPIFGAVLLEADGAALSLRVSDAENTLSTHLLAEGTLTACVNCEKLAKAVRPDGDADGEIEIDLTDRGVSVVADGMKLSLPVLPAEDFPPASPSGGWRALTTYRCGDFGPALDFVIASASTDAMRPHISAVAWIPKMGVIASTDGHRLHTFPAPECKKFKEKMVISLDAAAKLRGIVRLGDDALMMRRKDRIRFTVDEWTFEAKASDVDFPNVQQVIPQRESVATVDAAKVTRAFKKIMSLAQSGAGISVTVNGALRLSAGCDDEGVEVEVPILESHCSGQDFVTAVNPRYLIEALANTERADLTIRGAMDAVRIDAPDGRVVVVMPCRA